MLGQMKRNQNGVKDDEVHILDAIRIALPYLKECMKEDVMFALTDHEKFLAYIPNSEINLGVGYGDPIPPQDIALNHALKGKTTAERLPEEAYGVPFYGKTIPVTDSQNQVIGALGLGYNIKDQVMMENTVLELEEITKLVQDQTTSIAAHSEQLAATSNNIFNYSSTAAENTATIDEVMTIIRNVSSQTNLLGLNASIEAARAGEHGRGFSIVADEVRKLSLQSSDATEKVSSSVELINGNLNEIRNGLEDIRDSANDQATSIESFTRMVDNLVKITDTLEKYVERMK
ncbi:methyl-accepting chemotaxis protein [Bacillus tianshenii]|nr:methyl-accepting chemotaxis protein [Bacillus tianshenii]